MNPLVGKGWKDEAEDFSAVLPLGCVRDESNRRSEDEAAQPLR